MLLTGCEEDMGGTEGHGDMPQSDMIVLPDLGTPAFVLDIDAFSLYEQVEQVPVGGSVEVEIPLGANHDNPTRMVLNRTALFGDDFAAGTMVDGGRVELFDFPLRSFQGHLANDPSLLVSLTISPTFVGGTVSDGYQEFTLEPLALRREGVDGTIIYPAKDALAGQSPPLPCGTASPHGGADSRKALEHADHDDPLSPRGACWKLEVRAHGDYEYYANEAGKNFNVAAFAMAVALNEGSAKYGPLNLDLVVPSGGIVVLTDPNHSLYYPKSSDGGALLESVRDFWNFFMVSKGRDAVLLFTGKNITLDGEGIGGLAYLDVVCNHPTAAYGLVKWYKNAYTNVTVAHELGHMLGAYHTDEVTCPPGTGGGIMLGKTAPSPDAQFSKCSIDHMKWHIWFNNGCMSQGACS